PPPCRAAEACVTRGSHASAPGLAARDRRGAVLRRGRLVGRGGARRQRRRRGVARPADSAGWAGRGLVTGGSRSASQGGTGAPCAAGRDGGDRRRGLARRPSGGVRVTVRSLLVVTRGRLLAERGYRSVASCVAQRPRPARVKGQGGKDKP